MINKELLDKASIVDVRTPPEFSQEHFPGAVNIPLDQVAQRIDEFKKMKEPIVAYCKSGNRSGIATSMLKQSGMKEVYNGGGLSDLLEKSK